jgi:hypothetical protein
MEQEEPAMPLAAHNITRIARMTNTTTEAIMLVVTPMSIAARLNSALLLRRSKRYVTNPIAAGPSRTVK